MAGIGFALGGLAKGIQAGVQATQEQQALEQRQQTILQDQSLREKALGIQQQQLEREGQQDLMAKADKTIGQLMGVITETIKAARAGGSSPEQIMSGEGIQRLLANIDALATGTGRDPSIYRDQIQATLEAPTEAQQEVGKAKELQAAGVSKEVDPLPAIKGKIARGEELTPGESRLYNDSLKSSGNALAETLRALGIGEEAAPAATPTPGEAAAAPAPTIPPVPASLAGRGAKWSPSKQRWYLPDGSSYNQQGVPM